MIRFNKLTQAVVDNLVAIEAAGGEQAGEAREVINGVYADVPSFNENVERLAVDIAKKFGMSTAELLGVRVQKKEAPLGVILSPSLEHVRAMFASESGGRVQLSKLTIDVVACSLCPHSYYDDAKRRKMYRAVAADVLGYLVEAGVLKVENELGKEWYSVNTTGDAGGPCGGRAGAVRERRALWIWILSRLSVLRARASWLMNISLLTARWGLRGVKPSSQKLT